MTDVGKLLIVLGGLLLLVGLVLVVVGRVPGLGRLPGDILIQRGNWTFYFPIATSVSRSPRVDRSARTATLLLSLVLTLVLWLIGRR